MKVFIFYIGTPTPVFETELELIRKHEKAGDSVRVLQCSGNLPNCYWNKSHINSQCAMCRSKFKNGWEVLNPGKNVELKQFPVSTVNRADFPLFNSVEDIKRFQYDNENIGYGVVSSLLSITRDHRFDTQKYRNEITRELMTAVQVYKTLKREFQEFQPDLVYFFNGRITTHLPAKLLCRRMGIEFYSYEVSNKLNSYTLLKNATVHEIIPMEVVNGIRSNWSKEQKRVAESFFRRRRMGENFDKLLTFTKDQVKGSLPIGFDKNKKNIAIFNGTINEHASIEDYKNSIYEPDETAGIGQILETFEQDSRYMFYLRVHPNMRTLPNSTSQLVDIRELSSRFRNLCVIWPNDKIDTYALMDACEKTITFGSTIGVEATYWGRPSILAGNGVYKNFGCAYTPKTHDELIKLLKTDLEPLPVDFALQYIYWVMSDGIPFEYFKETGSKNFLAVGTFDGIEIKPSALSYLWHKINRFFFKMNRVMAEPSLIYKKLQKYLHIIN